VGSACNRGGVLDVAWRDLITLRISNADLRVIHEARAPPRASSASRRAAASRSRSASCSRPSMR